MKGFNEQYSKMYRKLPKNFMKMGKAFYKREDKFLKV